MSTTYGANTYLPPSPVVPMFLVIEDITNAIRAQVTVSTPNSYVVGQLMYFSVPFDYGMFQINGLTGQILSVDITNLIFTLNIDTSFFDRFVNPPSGIAKPATIAPAGARNIYNNTTVPFHSLGNIGN